MRKQGSKLLIPFLLSMTLVMTGCSKIWSTPEMQQSSSSMSTTGVSAAAGAAIGAGVGALIGSATGNAGEGFVLGAVAGAATGGLIGNELENQEEAIVEQDEVIRRHEELLDKQQREVEKLKQMSDRGVAPVATNDIRAPIINNQAGIKEQNALLPPARKVAGEPENLAPKSFSNNVSSLHGSRASLSGDVPPKREPVKVTGANRVYLKSPSGGASKQVSGVVESREIAPVVRAVAPTPEIPKVAIEKRAPAKTTAIIAKNTLPPARKQVAEQELEKIVSKRIQEPKKIVKKVIEPAPIKKIKTFTEEKKSKLEKAKVEQIESVKKSVEAPIAAIQPAKRDSSSKEVGCRLAEEEAERARNASSDADKLFYFRRAIRQCPKLALYHIEIGKVYMDIGRSDDAEFEFRQALDLDPENEQAQDQLTLLQAE